MNYYSKLLIILLCFVIWITPVVAGGSSNSDVSIDAPPLFDLGAGVNGVFKYEVTCLLDSATETQVFFLPVDVDPQEEYYIIPRYIDDTYWPGYHPLGSTTRKQGSIREISFPYLFFYRITEKTRGNDPFICGFKIYYDSTSGEFLTSEGNHPIDNYRIIEREIIDGDDSLADYIYPVLEGEYTEIKLTELDDGSKLPSAIAIAINGNAVYESSGGTIGGGYTNGFQGKIEMVIAVDTAPPNPSGKPDYDFVNSFVVGDASNPDIVYTDDDYLNVHFFHKNEDNVWEDTAQESVTISGTELYDAVPPSDMADEYDIYYTIGDSAESFFLGARGIPDEESQALPLITTEGIYNIFIRNFDRAGNSAYGERLPVVIDRSGPEAPSGTVIVPQFNPRIEDIRYSGYLPADRPLDHSAGTDGNYWLLITDTNDTAVESYRIYDPTGDIPDLAGLDDGIYRVSAVFQDYLGNMGQENDPVSFTVDTTAPGVVQNVSLVGANTLRYNDQWYALDNSVVISWSSVLDTGSGLSHYDLQYYSVDVNDWISYTGMGEITTTQAAVELDSLTDMNGSYTFRVVAVDSAGNRGVSEESIAAPEEISISMMTPPAAPDVSDPLYTLGVNDSYELCWEEVLWDNENVNNPSIRYRAFACEYSYYVSLENQENTLLEEFIAAQMNAAVLQNETFIPAEFVSGNTASQMLLGMTHTYILFVQTVVLDDDGTIITQSEAAVSDHFYIPSWTIEIEPEEDAYVLDEDEYWWEGIRHVTCTVVVSAGTQLTVAPMADIRISGQGTKIVVEEGGSLIVSGVLGYEYNSQITTQPTTVFHWDPANNADNPVWDGIVIHGEASISNVIIRDASRGIIVDTSRKLEIDNTTFIHNSLTGIHLLRLGSGSLIRNCVFSHNGLYGIKEDVDLAGMYPIYNGNTFIHPLNEEISERGYDFYSYTRGVISAGLLNESAGTGNQIVEIE